MNSGILLGGFFAMEESDSLTKMAKASRGANISPKQDKKKQVCQKILRQLADNEHEAAQKPEFVEELQAHFNRLPTRYILRRAFFALLRSSATIPHRMYD